MKNWNSEIAAVRTMWDNAGAITGIHSWHDLEFNELAVNLKMI